MSELIEKIDGQLAFADEAIDALIGTLSMYVHSLDIPSIKAGNFARGEIAIARRRIAALNATLADENAMLRERLSVVRQRLVDAADHQCTKRGDYLYKGHPDAWITDSINEIDTALSHKE